MIARNIINLIGKIDVKNIYDFGLSVSLFFVSSCKFSKKKTSDRDEICYEEEEELIVHFQTE